MKKILSTITTVLLLLVIAVSCAQDVTIDTQLYGAQGSGTFMLNGKYYNTLQEAVNARLGKGAKAAGANDDVIYLTRNAKGPGAKIDDSNISVIIDFAGWTYSFTDVTATQGSTTGSFGLSITGGADVTLKGLEQINLHDTTANLTMVYVEGADTKLTIEDAPKMKVEPTQYVFWAANGATLTVGSNSTTAPTTISGKIAATGGTAAESKPVITFNNNTTVKASELKADAAVVIINSSEASTVDSFVAANNTQIVVSGSGNVTVTDNNSKSTATYTIENTSSDTNTKVDIPTTSGENRTVTPGQKVDNDEDPVVDPTPSVAIIGNKLYSNLSDAISDAKSNDVVSILKDIVLDTNSSFTIKGSTTAMNLVIDGGNKSITANSDSSKSQLFLFSDYNTTHEESAACSWEIKNLTITAPGYKRVILVTGEAFNTIQFENVHISSNGECFYCNGPSTGIAKNCTFIFEGSSFPDYDDSDDVYHSAVIVGYGGNIILEDCIVESSKHGLATFPTGSSITATGSTKVTAAEYAIWSRCDNGTPWWCASDSEIIIDTNNTIGGKIRVTEPTAINGRRASINLLSGTFENIESFLVEDPTGTYSTDDNKAIVITGGIFDKDPSEYVAEGYVVKKTGASEWTVVKATEVEVTIGTEKKTMSLVEFAKKVNDGVEGYATATAKLLEDVDLDGVTWTPIGTSTNPFRGTLDGNDNEISNLNMTSTGTSAGYGLFGYVGGNCTIKSLSLSNCDLSYPNGKEAGLLVGVASNKDDDGSDSLTIIDVTIDSDCSVVVGDKGAGFVGRLYCNGTFTNVSNNANVSGNQRVSGLVAQCAAAKDVIFNNCHNYGVISLNKENDDYIKTGDSYGVAAGFVAHFNGANVTYDESCTSTGTINAPLAVSFIAYVNSTTLYRGNNTWTCAGGGNNSPVRTMKMKGVIEDENGCTRNYFVAIENAYHLEHGFDGIFYHTDNSYDVLFYGPNDVEDGERANIPIRMTAEEWNNGTYVTTGNIGKEGTHNPHTVVLLNSITWTRVYSFGTSIYLVVDLNGNTLTVGADGVILGAENGGGTHVTIKNGSLDNRYHSLIGDYISEENVTYDNVIFVK